MESSLIFQWPVAGQNCQPEFTPHLSSPWNVVLAVLDSGHDHESALPLHGLGELSLRSWKGAGALLVSDTFDWCRVEVWSYMKHEKWKEQMEGQLYFTPLLSQHDLTYLLSTVFWTFDDCQSYRILSSSTSRNLRMKEMGLERRSIV